MLIEAASQVAGGLDEALTALLGDALERGLIEDAAIAATLEQREAFWTLRENLSDAQKSRAARSSTTCRCRWARFRNFWREATRGGGALPARRARGRVRPLGDGNIHFNVSQPVGADKAAFLGQMGRR